MPLELPAELLLERGARIDIFAAAMLGRADTVKAKSEPLSDDQRKSYLGRFGCAALGDGLVEMAQNRNGDLTIAVRGQSPNVLRHAGNHTFFPTGAPAVRITFTGADSGMNSLTIVDHLPVLTAMRVS